MTATIIIDRYTQDTTQTLGICSVLKEDIPVFAGISLERGWQDNKRNVSCIPEGTYKVVLEYSPKFETMLWEIKGVPDRSECKFHAANYWQQLNGCVALGKAVGLLNRDSYYDVLSSGDTMALFHQALHGFTEATLVVSGAANINNHI